MINIVESFVTKNKCYQIGTPLKPRGIMLHSIGVPQPNASVMAQNYNQYRPNGQSVCVHAFVQRDGTVYQTLPWTVQAWHCGGAANQTHIGIEMTEPASIVYTGHGADWRDLDPTATETHVRGTYDVAVELFAQLCEQYALDPLEDGVIISHAEGAMRGVASHHADPTHLWHSFGLTMDGFRKAVAEAMATKNTVEEDENMTRYHSIDEIPEWARKEAKELVDSGALQGDTSGDLNVSEDMLRGAIIGMRYVEARNPRYYSLGDVPKWAQEETQKLIDRGALLGDEHGNLDVTMDMLRTMIVCQRMVDEK
jgi:hypothetical protein